MRLGTDLASRHVDTDHGEMDTERADRVGGLVTVLRFERATGERGDLAQRAASIGDAAHVGGACLERDVGGTGLEVGGRERDDLLAQTRRRLMHGGAGHHRGAAGRAAHAMRHPARVSEMHGDVGRRHLNDLGAHLRERGGKPLTERGRAGGQHDAALGGQGHLRALERAGARRLHDGREPDTVPHVAAGGVQLATPCHARLVPAGLQRMLEHLAEVLAGEVGGTPGDRGGHRADRVGLVFRPGEIAAADLGRIEPRPCREQIDDPLAHERALVEARRADGAGRCLAGHRARHAAAIGRPLVRAGQVRRGERRRPDTVRA